MRYRLSTLLIVLALGPPALAGALLLVIPFLQSLGAPEHYPPPPVMPLGSPAGSSGPHIIPSEYREEWTASERAEVKYEPPMFRFTIRDVLWLTVMVALAVGWWIDHQSLAPDAQKHRDARQRWEEYRDMLQHSNS